MLLRQVQARPLQGNHLRALRGRGHAAEGAPRAHGPHRPGGSGLAHLVLQGRSEPDRLPAGHRAARAREGALLRRLDRHPGRPREAPVGSRRPRGQGRRRDGEDLPGSRRGTVRARRPARPAARLLRRRQGAELRRGRRLLGARPEQLGRRGSHASARGAQSARRRRVHRARQEDHERGSAARPRARPPDLDARRSPAGSARGRVGGCGGDADRGRARAPAGRARKGVRVEEGRDHEASEARAGGPALRRGALGRGHRARRLGRPEESRPRARDRQRTARGRARRGRARRRCGRSPRARLRPLPRRGNAQGRPRRGRSVGAEGPRDGGRHGRAP